MLEEVAVNSVWFLSGLGVAGIALIIVGAEKNNPVLSSLGGAIAGATISAALALIDSRAVLDAIRKAFKAEFRSDELRIYRFRRRWHLYHVTRKEQKFTWLYHTIDFKKILSPGVLYSETHLIDKNGNKKKYIVTAGSRDGRFIMFAKGQQTDEPYTIAIFPSIGQDFQNVHCGIRVHRTWDRTESLSRSIMSKVPIARWTQIGDVNNVNVAKILDKIWEDEFSKLYHILPKADYTNT